MEPPKFEQAIDHLKEIVSKLEGGDLPLEEALSLFEKGIGLTKYCNQKLDEAEKKVEILLKNEKGDLRIEPFEHSPDEERP
jgi:exodeoxyribonuclease VII small subunit